nr:ABC transporter ATP-binding protein [Phascolarctobacterium sp.]
MVTLNSAALDLVLHQLYVHFPVPGGLVRAVDGVDICFRHQQITGIIGESGCGKSVLGQAILGILPDYVARSGNIFYRSTDILADNTSLPGFYGQQIALIPQNPGDSLNPLRTIGRQFDDILQTAGFNDKTNQRKQQLLTFFGLPDAERVLAAYPHELSGGMLQ